MQLHIFIILFPQQYSERQFTCNITENGILFLFQQLIENNYLKNVSISNRRFVTKPWLTHMLSKVREDIYKEKKSHTLLFFFFIRDKEITLVGIDYFYSLTKTS